MSELRKVSVAVLIEYEVEGDASPDEIGSAALRFIPPLPQFHVNRTICAVTALGLMGTSETNKDAYVARRMKRVKA
jgi:hypothetical protein